MPASGFRLVRTDTMRNGLASPGIDRASVMAPGGRKVEAMQDEQKYTAPALEKGLDIIDVLS
ncbi:MAG: hypothetical protein IPK28_16200 [Devosia sp.]|nr:hypothetical protein [Devosia sp.]